MSKAVWLPPVVSWPRGGRPVWPSRSSLVGVQYVIGSVLVLFALALLIGAVTGRVKASSCCAVADPRRDLRMREAFQDDDG